MIYDAKNCNVWVPKQNESDMHISFICHPSEFLLKINDSR